MKKWGGGGMIQQLQQWHYIFKTLMSVFSLTSSFFIDILLHLNTLLCKSKIPYGILSL